MGGGVNIDVLRRKCVRFFPPIEQIEFRLSHPAKLDFGFCTQQNGFLVPAKGFLVFPPSKDGFRFSHPAKTDFCFQQNSFLVFPPSKKGFRLSHSAKMDLFFSNQHKGTLEEQNSPRVEGGDGESSAEWHPNALLGGFANEIVNPAENTLPFSTRILCGKGQGALDF